MVQEDQVKQKKEIRFGIRELSYELMAQTAEKENIRFQYSPTDVEEGRSLFDYKKRVSVENPALSPEGDHSAGKSFPDYLCKRKAYLLPRGKLGNG